MNVYVMWEGENIKHTFIRKDVFSVSAKLIDCCSLDKQLETT